MIEALTDITTRSAVVSYLVLIVLVCLAADLSSPDVTAIIHSELTVVETGSRLLCVVSGMF